VQDDATSHWRAKLCDAGFGTAVGSRFAELAPCSVNRRSQ
jgi:hypothetical protein